MAGTRRRLALFLTAAAAGAAAAALAARAVRRRRRAASRQQAEPDDFDGLDSAVSYSARSIAAARAVETARGADALFRDPFAASFAGKALKAASARASDGRIAVRTRFFDDALADALAAAPGAQVVLLGAGLDSRAWRCAPPAGGPLAAAVFEVDRADVLAAKAAAFAALPGGAPPLTLAARYAAVSADLCSPDWAASLRAAGHAHDVPTVWLLEGLLYYMPQPDVAALLRACAAASAPGSALVASCVNTPALLRARTSGRSAAMRSFQSAVDAPADYFGAAGWRVTAAPRPGDPECSYGGRHAPPEADVSDASKPASYYVRAVLA